MTAMTTYPPGTFCWVDLATPDAEAARVFYTGLFGWTTDDRAGAGGTYTMLEKAGNLVGALYGMDADQVEAGIPPHWNSYVSVARADESAEAATRLGGTVVLPPFDVETVGRMAMVQDPTGAVLALWEPRTHTGAALVNEPGSFCWNELYTRDPDAATTFYTGLFGWTSETITTSGGQPYTAFRNGDRPAAGMMRIQEAWGDMPPNWAVYFAVGDLDAAMEKARATGGTIGMDPIAVPDLGRFAFVQDPQGAHFVMIQLAQT